MPQSPDVLVLNVNDHDGVRYMISRILERAGYAVAEATTGTEALEKGGRCELCVRKSKSPRAVQQTGR